MSANSLPVPQSDAAKHSEKLSEFIRQHIAQAGGAIPFSRFMELVLYAPGLGYYSAGSLKFGAQGDFITSPELGSVFANCVAESVSMALRACGPDACFMEVGGGSGAFAVDVLRALQRLDAVPLRYLILEPSADLRERQRQHIEQQLPSELAQRCHWLNGPPDAAWRGVLFANEVLDALPTSRFLIRDGEVFEEYVALDTAGQFIRVEQPADALLRANVRHIERYLGAPLPNHYRSEVLPQLPYWIQAIGGLIEQGAMIFVDYGYVRREFYSPQRSDGTLVCHYRHRAHSDPFLYPGLQDLTAFVDFTALAEAGTHAAFDFAGYCSQSSFLIANGLTGQIEASEKLEDKALAYQRKQEIKKLTLPGEMGERFQVMGFTRNIDLDAVFAFSELSRRL